MLIIIDDFFENPHLIRKYALTLNYYPFHEGRRGFRYDFECQNSIENLIYRQINDTITEKTSLKKLRPQDLELHFHLCPKSVMKSSDYIDNRYHSDGPYGYAGVIYLNPDPPENTGTCFSDSKCIENKFNRMILYPMNIDHAPNLLFGSTKEDCRMTVTFFAEQKPSFIRLVWDKINLLNTK